MPSLKAVLAVVDQVAEPVQEGQPGVPLGLGVDLDHLVQIDTTNATNPANRRIDRKTTSSIQNGAVIHHHDQVATSVMPSSFRVTKTTPSRHSALMPPEEADEEDEKSLMCCLSVRSWSERCPQTDPEQPQARPDRQGGRAGLWRVTASDASHFGIATFAARHAPLSATVSTAARH